MNVGIYQAWADGPAAQIHDLMCLVLAKADHLSMVNGNVGRMDRTGKDVHQPGILQQQVGWFFI